MKSVARVLIRTKIEYTPNYDQKHDILRVQDRWLRGRLNPNTLELEACSTLYFYCSILTGPLFFMARNIVLLFVLLPSRPTMQDLANGAGSPSQRYLKIANTRSHPGEHRPLSLPQPPMQTPYMLKFFDNKAVFD